MVVLRSTYVSSNDKIGPKKKDSHSHSVTLKYKLDEESFIKLMAVIRDRQVSLNELVSAAVFEQLEESMITKQFNKSTYQKKGEKRFLISIHLKLNHSNYPQYFGYAGLIRTFELSNKEFVYHVILNKIDQALREYNIQIDRPLIVDALTKCRQYSNIYCCAREETVKRYKQLA